MNKEFEILTSKYEALADAFTSARDDAFNAYVEECGIENVDFGWWDRYADEHETEVNELRQLSFEIRKTQPIKWSDYDGVGSLMTIDEWLSHVDFGGFIDYDGFGYYATEDKVSNISVVPSHAKRNVMVTDRGFTHIVWYNR